MSSSLVSMASALRKQQAKSSLLCFAQTYLPHYLNKAPSSAHREIHALIEDLLDRRGQKLALAAPRGFGKTTMITLITILYAICYETDRYIVIISSSSSQAIQFLGDIKKELESNEKLRMDFPELTGPSPRPWKRDDIVVPNNVRVLALGSGQRIRGRKYGEIRPTLVVADDFEDADNAFSLETQNKLRDWVTRSILKAGDSNTNYLFMGTLHHPHCLLAEFLSPTAWPDWTKRCYKAIVSWATDQNLWNQWMDIYYSRCDWIGQYGTQAAKVFFDAHQEQMLEGAEVLWSEKWAYYGLMVEYADDPIAFNSELQNEPINPRDCLFDVSRFMYWDDQYESIEALLKAIGDRVEIYGACDPSMGKGKVRGDYTAIIVLARDPSNGFVYVILADLGRYNPTQTIDAILAHHRLFNFRRFSMEANQFQELLVQEVERRGRESGQYLSIEQVKNTADKDKRIQALHPYTVNGTLRFSRSHRLLLEQCQYFPKARHDDGLDALEMAMRLCGQRRSYEDLIVSIPNTGGMTLDMEF